MSDCKYVPVSLKLHMRSIFQLGTVKLWNQHFLTQSIVSFLLFICKHPFTNFLKVPWKQIWQFVGYALVSKSGENIQSTFVSEILMKFSVFPCLNVKFMGQFFSQIWVRINTLLYWSWNNKSVFCFLENTLNSLVSQCLIGWNNVILCARLHYVRYRSQLDS